MTCVCDTDSPSSNIHLIIFWTEWHNTYNLNPWRQSESCVFCFQFVAICKNKLGANFTLAIAKTCRPPNIASKASLPAIYIVQYFQIYFFLHFRRWSKIYVLGSIIEFLRVTCIWRHANMNLSRQVTKLVVRKLPKEPRFE